MSQRPNASSGLYPRLVRALALPLAERLQGMPVQARLGELETSQWWPPERIRELQWAKLQRLLAHAYANVPYYRRRMDEAGVAPTDIRDWPDLARLPISEKDDLRAAGPEQTRDQGVELARLLPYASSGSTGEPFRYGITKAEKAQRWAIVFRYWGWAGLWPGVRYVNVTGGAPGAFKGRPLLRRVEQAATRVMELSAFELYEGNAAAYVERIRRFRPWAVRGYASTMDYLARHLQAQGQTLPVGAVLTLGETLYPQQRQVIQAAFGCPVYDAYGGEAMEAAAQCPQQAGGQGGYHINAESILVEVVDDAGRPLPPGRPGQLVLTNLDNYAMPFIRYNIQDVGALSAERCPCGRGLPVLESVEGRLTDTLVTPAGKVLVVHFFTLLLMRAEGIDHYQVVQERPERMVLRLVPNAHYNEAEEARLLAEVRRYVGPDVQVAVERVAEIPLTRTGKRRFFVSHVHAAEVLQAWVQNSAHSV
ncbi:MAG: phenylacetate--CoA ligase family protein [Chloroflexi bacterium]|nr:phenylacetate--CoA ligase family protein [Chloroflexota bacterium]